MKIPRVPVRGHVTAGEKGYDNGLEAVGAAVDSEVRKRDPGERCTLRPVLTAGPQFILSLCSEDDSGPRPGS